MQRFGTASIPTHAIGLALLQSDWRKAVDLIMRPRPGESPDIQEARRAWNDRKDIETALALMPRRVVAERCLLESFQKMNGDIRNLVGALATVCRHPFDNLECGANLRRSPETYAQCMCTPINHMFGTPLCRRESKDMVTKHQSWGMLSMTKPKLPTMKRTTPIQQAR